MKSSVAPLRSISTKEWKQGKYFLFHGEPNAKYAWDCGQAIGRYLYELKQGKLIARKCNQCRRVLIPPRLYCEFCFRDTDEWVAVKDTGKINTFSVCFISWNMKRLKIPQIPAVIEMDGASPGFGLMHLIQCRDWKTLKIGVKVKAIWKPKSQRRGAITDIKHFVPLDSN